MRNLFFIAVLILAVSISSYAQTSPDYSCPVIQVFGPAGIIPPNEVASYRAEVDTKGQQLDLKYFWSVSAGKIISGQGTLNIEVRQPENASLTVTVEVNGVPEGCPNTASENSFGDPTPTAILVDESSVASDRINKRGLDKLVEELKRKVTSFGISLNTCLRTPLKSLPTGRLNCSPITSARPKELTRRDSRSFS